MSLFFFVDVITLAKSQGLLVRFKTGMEKKFIKTMPMKQKALGSKYSWTWMIKEPVDAKTRCINVSKIFHRNMFLSLAETIRQ